MKEEFQEFDISSLPEAANPIEDLPQPFGLQTPFYVGTCIDKDILAAEEKRQAEGQQTSFEKAVSRLTVEELREIKERQAGGDKDSQQEEIQPFFGHPTESATFNPKKEQPHHRAICILLAQGYVPKEVAEMTGFTTVTVNYVRQQPWALKFIAELMNKAGRKVVMSELQGAALEAARTLINTMRNEENGAAFGSKASDRAKAANDILNRLYGTAPQVVAHGNIDVKELTDDVLATLVTGNQ